MLIDRLIDWCLIPDLINSQELVVYIIFSSKRGIRKENEIKTASLKKKNYSYSVKQVNSTTDLKPTSKTLVMPKLQKTGINTWADKVAVMINPTEISQYMVLFLYTSAGVPSKVMADIKLESRDIATGNTDKLRPARRNSFSLF